MKKRIIFFLAVAYILSNSFSFGQTIQERFQGKDTLDYLTYFNGASCGAIQWRYLGKQTIDSQQADVLSIITDTKVIKFLNMESNERVFLDSVNHLPIKVERDILLFGKKELVAEYYDQDNGIVKVIKNTTKKEETILKPNKPIHNILALLYFFPQGVDLKTGEWIEFNLPTQKVKIKTIGERLLSTKAGKKETIFVIGRGAKRFNLWLDKKERIPLRLEFILPIGKVTIIKK